MMDQSYTLWCLGISQKYSGQFFFILSVYMINVEAT